MTPLEQAVLNSKRLRPRTQQAYLAAVRSFQGFAGANWNGLAVEAWQNDLRKRMKPQSANLHLAGLRYACKRASALTNDPALNFAHMVESSKVEISKVRRALSREQVKKLLATTAKNRPHDLRDRAIIILGVRTGLRRDGMVNLTFADVKSNALTVTLKGGRRHTIYLDTITMDALHAWMAYLSAGGVRTGPVFRSMTILIDGKIKLGKSLNAGSLYDMIRKRAAECKFKTSPHILRHTFVSWCKQLGVPDYRIQAMTGHKSTAMLSLYTTDLEAESKPVGEMLGGW